MKTWADAVARLDIQCPECRSIADRIVRSESLVYDEKHHIEVHVTRTPSNPRYSPCSPFLIFPTPAIGA